MPAADDRHIQQIEGPFHISGNMNFAAGAKRLAVDPQGNPWVVDFNGDIFRFQNGGFHQLPGTARDIGIGGDGLVWIIGTNSLNGSFQVYGWVDSAQAWVADPGSGDEIDVTADGMPMVNGSDGKMWIRNGGPNSGWSQFGANANQDLRVFDLGLSPCARGSFNDPGTSEFWTVDNSGFNVWNWENNWFGPHFISNGSLPAGNLFADKIAVDTGGRIWAVQDTQGHDAPGPVIERTGN